MLESLKVQENDAISILASIFEIQVYVGEKMFDKAYQLFELHENLPECSFSILKRMAGIIILQPHCPMDYTFLVVKKLHLSSKLSQLSIDDYAKWTRILVSVALKRNNSQDLFDCFVTILQHQLYKKAEYPQHQLYYLIVIAWNEGITCCFRSNPQGKNWCRIAFEILAYFNQDEEKKHALEEQMSDAYRLFESSD
ncbi:uncharacterized protein B0P05DRAFT_92144 [Gilbertella persicaria]|uniref:uncharacterized protein n=1 Tax=Gilbertella persicaria TaxID=101096 RepID=UPI002220B340|nr:uncharacterized protein B0P05DRAFT_92144 [Gilbertella persicaria]KAI8097802.1 hypothetical protein B0P05DRAFT_92144 [Gilbertella persicaria]